MHVHVECGDGKAKFWMNPLQLASSHRLKAAELKKARLIIEKHVDLIKEKWHGYFSNK